MTLTMTRLAVLATALLTMAAAPQKPVAPAAAKAPAAVIAATPPMGWNSWDCFGTGVTEAEVKANADYMASRLRAHGWHYIVVDIQWSEQNPKSHGYQAEATLAMDGFGRLVPAPNRFPSSADGKGFKPLADYVHGLGLKFGIHIMRGIPRRAVKENLPVAGNAVHAAAIADPTSVCPWNPDMYGVDMSKPHAQDYYDSIIRLYADWGVDYIKADDIARPAHQEEIAAIHRAIVKSGRPIVLSISPGPAQVKDAEFFRENVNLWRVSDDFWDEWRLLRLNFTLMSIWSGYGRPGAWPDGDMLPLGHIGLRAERGDARMSRFTPDEQHTLMSLWSIAQSPLMFGGHLPDNDDATLALITNDEVLAVNQQGRRGRAIAEGGPAVTWMADAVDPKTKYLAVFNIGERTPVDIRVNWRALGLPARCTLRDLWSHTDLGPMDDGHTFTIAPHASGLYKVTAVTGQ
jgi:alpha-galactosidase